jgi:dephospho-CoA kinase
MLKVGLTGGIGSGKSEVSKFFHKWGAFILDADKEAKKIIDKNEKAQQEIIKEFGSDVINIDNKIDKQKLARVAFQDEFHQLNLNSIIHPYVFKKIDETFDKIKLDNKHKIFVVDAALIYESGADTHMDYVIVVTSLLRYRTERVMSRQNITRDDFMKRVSLQWSDGDKEHLADFIIQNNSDLKNLEKESKNIFKSLF